MKRAATSHYKALPVVGIIRSPEEALRVSARLALQFRSLTGRARLARAVELEELCRMLEQRIEAMEQEMAELREDMERSRRNATACIAYTTRRSSLG